VSFLRFAVSNLLCHRVRTLITLVSVAAAAAVLFTLLSFNRGYERGLKSQLQAMGIHMLVVPVGCPYEAASLILEGGEVSSFLPETALAEVRSLDQIAVAAPTFMSGVVRPDEGRTDIYLGIDSTILQLKNSWRLKGHLPVKPNDVVLGYDVAQIELSHIGDQIYLPDKDLTLDVVGELEPTGTQDDGFFYVPLKTAQAMFGRPGMLTSIMIRLKDPEDAPIVTSRLSRINGAEVVTMSELLGTMMTLMGSARALLLSIVLIVIVISGLGVLNTVLMSVFERTRDIGVMRATGARRLHVFALVWLETLLIALVGGVSGLVAAIFTARALEGVVKRFMPLAPRASVVAMDPAVFLLVLAFVIGIAIVAGFYPALRAAGAKPIEALKSE
jgi:putative ABC transport system permease protein